MRCHRPLAYSVAALALLACAAAGQASAAPACEPDKVATKYPSLAGVTVKVGQDGESPPFSNRDPKEFDKLIGLDADLARAVFDCAGVKMEFSTGKWSGLIPATINGTMDVMWDSLLYTPERAKQMDFVAYMNSATGMLVAKDNPKNLKTLDDFCGVTASAGLGTTQEVMLKQQSEKCVAAGKKAIDILTAQDMPGGARLVENGRADVYASNKFLIENLAKTNPKIAVAFDVKTDAILAAGTTKNKPDLVQAILDGLVVLEANGELKKIFETNGVDYSLARKPEILTK